ncbi:MAG: head decoration protein [Betaproteobacteria bacterium]|nr:head decoration protein [Betaproteobacteria bacterium]
MSAITEGLNLGDLLKYEAPNLYSRDQITVAAGQNLVLGTVVGIDAATDKIKALDPAATDGTELAAGVLAISIDASLIDRPDGILIARHAMLADHALTWPAGITAPQKAVALTKLKSLGIIVRQGV